MAWEVVTWQFMKDYMVGAIDSLNQMYTEAVGMFSRVNPFNLSNATFGGDYAAASNLKDVISGISEVIAGVALPLCTLFFLLEFAKKSLDLQWVKWENIFLFLIKLIFAKVVIENSLGIMEWIYTVFNNLALTVSTKLGTDTGGFIPVRPVSEDPSALDYCNFFLTQEERDYYISDGGFWGLARLLKIIELMPSVFLAQGIMLVTGVVIFARVFEVIVYSMVAPIPLSSFANEEHRQIGIGFIKSYAAVCLQALMIVIMFAAFAALGNELSTLQGSYASGSWGILLRVVLLGIGIFKSGNWSKKLCGAM